MSARKKIAVCLSLSALIVFPQVAAGLVAGRWVKPQGNGVVVASGGTNTLTVCRVALGNGTKQPGNLWQGVCYYGLDTREGKSETYEVLLDDRYTWENPTRQQTGTFGTTYSFEIASNAIDGGEAGNGVRFGVCEAYSDDSRWRPGKYYSGRCYIAWKGKERGVDPHADGRTVRVLVKK